ncbi:MAG: hypothetical protein N3A53_02085 [Verrucomicrobiae bacterium]|nr:hypothetical protein [Verrucomicrobiae bacterium]
MKKHASKRPLVLSALLLSAACGLCGVIVPAGAGAFRRIDAVPVVTFDRPRGTNAGALVSSNAVDWLPYDATTYSPPVAVIDGTNAVESCGFVRAPGATVSRTLVTNSVQGLFIIGAAQLRATNTTPPTPP